jgi:hypothetical protein
MAQECQVGSCTMKAWLQESEIGGFAAFPDARDVAGPSWVRNWFAGRAHRLVTSSRSMLGTRGRTPIPGGDTYHFRAASFSSRALRSSSGEAEPP